MVPTRLVQDWMTAPATEAVMAALRTDGAEARFIGGCVRDAVLERPIKDIDIATTATPETVLGLLAKAGIKSVPTGIKHGTVTAVIDKKPFEITTLRCDVETDGRHAVVAFTEDWQADAERRDFTMNTLSLASDGELFDYTGGYDDALGGRVRFVGDAETRIEEDVLRLLRFYRFFAHYGAGAPDRAARAACRKLAPLLPTLSGERTRQEALNLLAAPDPTETIGLMRDDRIFPHCLREADNFERLGGLIELEKTLAARNDTPPPDAELRLAALIASDREKIAALAERLKVSNAQRKRLLAATDPPPPLDGLPEALYRLGAATVLDRLLLDWAAHGTPDGFAATLETIGDWTAPKFPLSGKDGMAAGLEPGPELGRHLEAVETWWIARGFAPDRAQCLEKLRALISNI